MKKFFKEFKTFITRGNVLDMAVGIIIGGAFTAIVTALTTYILTPIINWVISLIFGDGGIGAVYTFLVKTVDSNGAIDLANSIYIDWGAFIGAIINFLLVALVLFSIIKTINKIKENNDKLINGLSKGKLTKEQKAELKAAGVNVKDKAAVEAYLTKKAAEEQAAKEQAEKEAEEKAKAERLANPTAEDLLKDIKLLLEKQAK